MPKAYRIVKPQYAAAAFDGEGARLFGGRWNAKGTRMVYTSASASLAALETFVHLGIDARTTPHVIIEIDIPDELIETATDFPVNWNDNPAPQECSNYGSEWVHSGRSAVLRVPSVIMEIEYNFLINPNHPDFAKLTIGAPSRFSFDDRMWKVGSKENTNRS